MDGAASRALTFDAYLTLVERHLAHERHTGLVTGVTDAALGLLLATRVPVADAVPVHERLAAACRTGLDRGGDPVAFTRGLARSSRDVDELRRWLAEDRTDHHVPLDPPLRWTVVQRLALLDGLDADAIEAERRRDRSAEGDLGAAAARAARPLPEAKEEAWSELVSDEVSNRRFAVVAAGLWSAEQAELTAPYFMRYLEAAPRLAQRGPAFAYVVGEASKTFLIPPAQVEQLRGALAGQVPTVLRRAWEDVLDDRT
jgi:aminopeptidase N